MAPNDAQKEAIVDEASKATSVVVEQSVEESKCNANNASSWNDYPATEEEHTRRIHEASNAFMASNGRLGKICPLGIHSGYAIYDCECDSVVALFASKKCRLHGEDELILRYLKGEINPEYFKWKLAQFKEVH